MSCKSGDPHDITWRIREVQGRWRVSATEAVRAPRACVTNCAHHRTRTTRCTCPCASQHRAADSDGWRRARCTRSRPTTRRHQPLAVLQLLRTRINFICCCAGRGGGGARRTCGIRPVGPRAPIPAGIVVPVVRHHPGTAPATALVPFPSRTALRRRGAPARRRSRLPSPAVPLQSPAVPLPSPATARARAAAAAAAAGRRPSGAARS